MTITDDWYGLYRAGWKNLIVDDAFQHPAKFARNLIKQIYDHCLVCHWLEAGDTVVDPFGGVALGGLDAMRLGLNWIGVELEPKFVDLGNRNIALLNQRYSDKFMRWGTARLLQGDSRRLLEVIAGADAAISSPPYAESLSRNHYGDGIDWGKAKTDVSAGVRHQSPGQSVSSDYGTTPGNLGNLRADDDGFAAAVNADAVVSSPPFHRSGTADHKGQTDALKNGKFTGGGDGFLNHYEYALSGTDGQLATESGDTFWSAARVIVAQTFAALRPGGHAMWVVKAFVRDSKRVEFPDQWRQLCESVGFVTLHVHRAWLVEDHGAQLSMDGNHKNHRTERKSFFRREAETRAQAKEWWKTLSQREQMRWLAAARQAVTVKPTEKKILAKAQKLAYVDARKPPLDVEQRIDNETIICMEKPGA